ncbi:MAG: Hyalin [Frankiales bacterium]|nr:Hyalin [Frankiales bacterium]
MIHVLRTRRPTLQHRGRRVVAALGAGALVVALGTPALATTPGVAPSTVTASILPGGSFNVGKTVTTPEIPPRPDVVLLADTTGSMGAALANVQTQLTDITNAVTSAQPGAEFAVASYKDETDGAGLFSVNAPLTGVIADVQTGANSLSASGGGDLHEGQLNALNQVATGAIAFRPGSTRIVVWFGDASGHDPSNGVTESAATSALQAAGIRVIAINVETGSGDGLDVSGQASRITSATGGTFQNATSSADLSNQIVAGLTNLPTTVTWQLVDCAPLLNVSEDVLSRTVTSGSDATFTETVSAPLDAPQGGTLTCTVQFLVNGLDAGPAFTETITVHVQDVTPPVVVVDDKTVEATSPAGAVITYPATAVDNVDGTLTPTCTPPSGSTFAPGATTVTCTAKDAAGLTGSDTAVMRVVDTTPPTGSCPPGPNPDGVVPASGNPDGFYRLLAHDAVDSSPDLYVVDAAAPTVRFGPYVSGTTIKLTQATGATQSAKPGTGAVNWKITLKGDAQLVAVDDAGNRATVATCLVPRPPK